MSQEIQRDSGKKELTDSMKKGTDNDEASCCDHQTLSKCANHTHEGHSQLSGIKRSKSSKRRQRTKKSRMEKRRMESDLSGKSSEENIIGNSLVPTTEQETCGKEGNTVCIMNASADIVLADKNDDEVSKFDHGILTSNGSNLSKGANGTHESHSELYGMKTNASYSYKKRQWRKKRRMESDVLGKSSEEKKIVESLTGNSLVPSNGCYRCSANVAHEIRSELNVVKRKTNKQRQRKKRRMGLERTSTVGSLIDTSLAQVAENGTSILPGTLRSSIRKKSLVLDLNGLLCDVVYGHPKADRRHPKADRRPGRVGGSAVFRRPFCDDFMRFCCEKFNIGVWSSRKRENVTGVVDLIMSGVRDSLLFCWDASRCTYTRRGTIGNRRKPLVLKQLKKLWNNEGGDLPWEEGDYSPSDTLLIDDSPYKALCNPPYTGIFPCSYSYTDEDDDFLGPGGDLRVYLEYIREASFWSAGYESRTSIMEQLL